MRFAVVSWCAVAALFFAVMLGTSIGGIASAGGGLLFAMWLSDTIACSLAVVFAMWVFAAEVRDASAISSARIGGQ